MTINTTLRTCTEDEKAVRGFVDLWQGNASRADRDEVQPGALEFAAGQTHLLRGRGVSVVPRMRALLLWMAFLPLPVAVSAQGVPNWGELSAGDVVNVEIKAADESTHSLAFRYCPAGEAILGDVFSGSQNTKVMTPFLMLETELDVRSAHALADPDIWQQIVGRVAPLNDPDAKSNVSDPEAAGTVPLTYINLDEAVAICEAVTRSGISIAEVPVSAIEAWELRMPTHAEWQYACRATASEEAAQEFPYFSSWPNYEDLPNELKGKCIDQWEGKLGKPAEDFNGGQEQVVALFEKYDKGENPGPAEILGELLSRAWWKDSVSRGYTSASMTGPPRIPESLLPNAWGFRGMNDNACEWVLCFESPADLRSYCRNLEAEGSVSGGFAAPVVFLAGGSTREFLQAEDDWKVYSIWGGRPMRGDGFGIEPKSWAAANGEPSLVLEHAAGCRFVVDRVLSPEWASRVRGNALVATEKEAVDQLFTNSRATVNGLLTDDERGPVLEILATYEALARYRVQDSAGAVAAIRSSLQTHSTEGSKPKVTLGDILGRAKPATTPKPAAEPQLTEDELYRQAFLMLVSSEVTEQ